MAWTTAVRLGVSGRSGLPNWRMSAPAMKARPAPVRTTPFTESVGVYGEHGVAQLPAHVRADGVDRRVVQGHDADAVQPVMHLDKQTH